MLPVGEFVFIRLGCSNLNARCIGSDGKVKHKSLALQQPDI